MVTGKRALRGVGVIEAPRGTLIHHYRINEDDQIVRANLIVSTTHNNQAMNEAVRQVALQYLDGRKLTEALLNHIEVAIRAYDPCLSCATHALGQMPLEVELVDAAGRQVDVLRRERRRHRRPAPRTRRVTRLVVLAWGNPSRGDDALGPEFLRAAEGIAPRGGPSVEFVTDFQLQPEHALDVAGRDLAPWWSGTSAGSSRTRACCTATSTTTPTSACSDAAPRSSRRSRMPRARRSR